MESTLRVYGGLTVVCGLSPWSPEKLGKNGMTEPSCLKIISIFMQMINGLVTSIKCKYRVGVEPMAFQNTGGTL